VSWVFKLLTTGSFGRKGKPPGRGHVRILAAKCWSRECACVSLKWRARPGALAACRAGRFDPMSLPPGSATLALLPALRRKQRLLPRGAGAATRWPYRLTPDRSGPSKLGECRSLFKSDFSMTAGTVIAGSLSDWAVLRRLTTAWRGAACLRPAANDRRRARIAPDSIARRSRVRRLRQSRAQASDRQAGRSTLTLMGFSYSKTYKRCKKHP
jgi:hypothetical protein